MEGVSLQCNSNKDATKTWMTTSMGVCMQQQSNITAGMCANPYLKQRLLLV